MLGECACGEVLMERVATCPQCGAPNKNYSPPSPISVPVLLAVGVVGGLSSLVGVPRYVPVVLVLLLILWRHVGAGSHGTD